MTMARNTKHKNPLAVKTRIEELAKGIQGLAPTVAIDVQGTSTPAGQVLQDLGTDLGRYTRTDEADVAYQHAKQDRDGAQEATLARLEAVEIGLRAKLGTSNPELKLFGLQPKRPRKKKASTPKET